MVAWGNALVLPLHKASPGTNLDTIQITKIITHRNTAYLGAPMLWQMDLSHVAAQYWPQTGTKGRQALRHLHGAVTAFKPHPCHAEKPQTIPCPTMVVPWLGEGNRMTFGICDVGARTGSESTHDRKYTIEYGFLELHYLTTYFPWSPSLTRLLSC